MQSIFPRGLPFGFLGDGSNDRSLVELVQYADEYALVLRLVVISLLIPADTSECERIFSLMNDLKTAERNSMGQQNLELTREPDAVAHHGLQDGRGGQKGQDAVL